MLAQQVLVARLRENSADGDETWAMDMWDGYPAERQAMLGLLPEVGTPNPIVLTGDIHSNWVADLHTHDRCRARDRLREFRALP